MEYASNLAKMLTRLNRFEEAEPLLRALATALPNNPDVLSSLGIVLAQRGQPAEGLEKCRAAVALAPGSAVAQFRLGLLLADGRKVDEARAAFQAALAADPNFSRGKPGTGGPRGAAAAHATTSRPLTVCFPGAVQGEQRRDGVEQSPRGAQHRQADKPAAGGAAVHPVGVEYHLVSRRRPAVPARAPPRFLHDRQQPRPAPSLRRPGPPALPRTAGRRTTAPPPIRRPRSSACRRPPPCLKRRRHSGSRAREGCRS